ncbi:MAG: thiol reductant ABC exporter subunit CydD [Saezia sp.]
MEVAAKKIKKEAVPLWTVGAVLQLTAALLWIPQAWVLAIAIDAMARQDNVWETALSCGLWFVGLGLARAGLNALGVRKAYLRSRGNLTQMRQEAILALSVRSPLDITRPTSGRVASVLGEQAEMVIPYLARYQPVRLKVMVVPVVMLIAVFSYSWLAALMLMFAAPLIPVFMVIIGFGAQKASENQILQVGQMNGFLLDRLRGLSTIRAFGGVDMIARRLREVSEEVRKKTMKVLSIAFLSSAVMELFSSLGVAMVAAYIGFHLLGEELQFGAWAGRMTLEQGMFILLLAPTFFDPLRELSAVWHDRASGAAAMSALKELQNKGVSLVGGNELQSNQQERDALPAGALSIVAKNVSFQYAGAAEKAIDQFNLNVRPGEKVALVAPSGYGKSTLLALFAGLLPVTEGSIEVGGVPLDDDTADVLRTRMGWISQHPHVFAGSLLQNITLGRKQINHRQIDKAIRAAALNHVAQRGLDRRLGEGANAGISGGEVLRLALARAMASPDLGLLLADEPTAHLDSDTVQEVIDGIMALANQGVTLIVATHDERLLPYMDQIIRLEELFARGRI